MAEGADGSGADVRAVADPTVVDSRSNRRQAVRKARLLNAATIGWNAVEGVVAVAAGLAAGSASLIGFGFDSAVEVSAALILAWRLRQERKDGCMQESDRLATRAIAVSFGALAAYVAFDATSDLVTRSEPDASVVGIVVAALSLAVMPWLARAKRRVAPLLGSAAAAADAKQTDLCAILSGVLLAGLAAHALLGWWWADPVAAMGISAIAVAEAVRTWRADSLEDTCCA